MKKKRGRKPKNQNLDNDISEDQEKIKKMKARAVFDYDKH